MRTVVQQCSPLAGTSRSQANAAARAERLRAAGAGRPYQGQADHVPDTALTGLPQRPVRWLDMPGRSNRGGRGGLEISHDRGLYVDQLTNFMETNAMNESDLDHKRLKAFIA